VADRAKALTQILFLFSLLNTHDLSACKDNIKKWNSKEKRVKITAIPLEQTIAEVAKICLRFRTSHCKGCKSMPEIPLGLLRGWQNLARNQGIKMQGLQNLPSNSI
jgi:hypothetical protein